MNPVIAPSAALPTLAGTSEQVSQPEKATRDPEITRAARQFEAVFVRMMLEPMQKTAESQSKGGMSGGGAYGSMIVDALSDAIANSGGVGLTHLIEEALSRGKGGAR